MRSPRAARTPWLMLLVVGLAGVPAAEASAKLPKLSKIIVLNESIGGIRLRDSYVALAKKHGRNGALPCNDAEGAKECKWTTPGPIDQRSGRPHVADAVTLEFQDPNYPDTDDENVVGIEIAAVDVDPRRSQLRHLKTSKGIGIGSTYKAARRAYPKARYDKLLGRLHIARSTDLELDSSRHWITKISMERAYPNTGPEVPRLCALVGPPCI